MSENVKTHEEFLKQVVGRPFDVIGKYTGSRCRIKCICHKCHNVFERRQDAVIQYGCNACRSHNKILSDDGVFLEVDVSSDTHPRAIMNISKDDWIFIKKSGVGKIHAVMQGDGNSIYAQGKIEGKTVYVHRLIFKEFKMIDHISGNGLDNRRSNLRQCTYAQNNMNAKVRSHNKLGVKGVSIDNRTGRFYANIRANGKCVFLGAFDTTSEAKQAYDEASRNLHGEFAYINR